MLRSCFQLETASFAFVRYDYNDNYRQVIIMMLHHYIWGDIDIDIVEEVAPHFLIAKHYGNLALFCRLTKHQSHYFRNSDKRFYAVGFDDKGKSMNPSDEYIPFVPDILYDDDGIGYLCLMQPSWLHTIDDIKHKIDGIIATDKKIREHDEYYVGSLRDNIISYELVQRVE